MEDPPLCFSVDESILEDEEITWAVRRILLKCPGSPSVMRVEHLRQWLIAATQDDSPDATNCLKVVAIVQAAFQDRKLAEECMWQTVVLIPKGEGE